MARVWKGVGACVATALIAIGLWVSTREPQAARLSQFPDRYTVRGIDVSHHNGDIDWPRVAQSGLQFVYVKATEGGDRTDSRFETNMSGARSAGLKTGAYHFFTFCRPGEDQAAHFLSRVKLEANDLPPAVDVEFVGNCRTPPEDAVVRENLEKWLAQVEAALGKRPIIYSTPDAAAAYLAGLPHPVWMRMIPGEPKEDWTFWQFHPGGSVPGIDGPVDLDVFRHDRDALDSL